MSEDVYFSTTLWLNLPFLTKLKVYMHGANNGITKKKGSAAGDTTLGDDITFRRLLMRVTFI